MKKTILFLLFWLLVSIPVFPQMDLSAPRNIILMISDGGGYNQIMATDFFCDGAAGTQAYEKFPVRMAMSTYPAMLSRSANRWGSGYNPSAYWSDFSYMDSASTNSPGAATAMSTGIKTYNDAIGLGLDGKRLTGIADVAKYFQKSVGVVTTVPFAHATPAGFVAHAESRELYSQIAMEMILDSRIDVIMGCGHPYYDNNGRKQTRAVTFKYVGDSTIWAQLQDPERVQFTVNGKIKTLQDIDFDGEPDAWTLISTPDQFRKLTGENIPKRVLGIPLVHETLQEYRTWDSLKARPWICPMVNNVPTLKDMSTGALNVLASNPNGFFVMIEGGAIDWANHDKRPERLIEEQTDFNKAIDAVIDWVNQNSSWNETLLIITSDHECGKLWGPGSGGKKFIPVINHGKGMMPGMHHYSNMHTNSLVPIFAKGVGSELFTLFADETDPVRGNFINNTEIAQLVFLLWGKRTE